MAIDFLAFGPHPDDADIGCGGLLRKMKALGYSTGIIDMTTGDMGWGTPEIRLAENEAAARILTGSAVDEATIAEAVAAAEAITAPAADGHGPAAYRTKMAGVMVRRALTRAKARAR